MLFLIFCPKTMDYNNYGTVHVYVCVVCSGVMHIACHCYRQVLTMEPECKLTKVGRLLHNVYVDYA